MITLKLVFNKLIYYHLLIKDNTSLLCTRVEIFIHPTKTQQQKLFTLQTEHEFFCHINGMLNDSYYHFILLVTELLGC